MTTQEKPQRLRAAEMASAHLNQRREVRYIVPLEIEVSGVDHNGRMFRERVLTRDVSEWGCGFLSPVELRVDDIIALRLISSPGGQPLETHQALFQVVRATRERRVWSVGAWKLEPGDVWGVDLARIGKLHAGDLASRRIDSDEHGPEGTEP